MAHTIKHERRGEKPRKLGYIEKNGRTIAVNLQNHRVKRSK